MSQNKIEKRIDLKAPVSRVWKALTDHREFGQWFGCIMAGPFVVGQAVAGQLTFNGFEDLKWGLTVKALEPEHYFAFSWNPYPVDRAIDYSKETPTLVEFRLSAKGSGTSLVVTESGFDQIPAGRRLEAFRMNTEGWVEQLENIAKYVG